MSTTNLASAPWQPLPQTPVLSGNALVVLFPFTNSIGYFRLQQSGGGCAFQATPQAITAGGSSTLTWCPVPGTTYTLSPGGIVTGGSVVVSPTVTTVYTLTASNPSGVETNTTAVLVWPCAWLPVTNLEAELDFSYAHAVSTFDYNFDITHQGHVTFHLTRQATTATDAYYFGVPTGGTCSMNDREDDKTTPPRVYTTTEVGSSPPLPGSTLILHVTCGNTNTYDFTYNVFMSTTETSDFGVTTQEDGVGAGSIGTRLLKVVANTISDSEDVPAQYPPSGSDWFTPSSFLGEEMFDTGTVNNTTAGNASVSWSFTPVP